MAEGQICQLHPGFTWSCVCPLPQPYFPLRWLPPQVGPLPGGIGDLGQLQADPVLNVCDFERRDALSQGSALIAPTWGRDTC